MSTAIAADLNRPLSLRILRAAFLTVVLVFVVFPLVWLAIGSLKTRHDALAMPPEIIFQPTFEAYQKIVGGGFLNAFGNSITIAITNVILALVLGTPAAYALTRMAGKAPRTAAAVNPAADDAFPDANTLRGASLDIYDNICDFAVPGSPTSKAWISPRVRVPSGISFAIPPNS